MPSVLYTNPLVPAQTLGEFIAYAKAHPGKLSYASPSVGTTPHLAVERLKQLTGIDLVHIPYRGAPPAMQALIVNDVQLYLVGWGVGRSHVEAGRSGRWRSPPWNGSQPFPSPPLSKAACRTTSPRIGGASPHHRAFLRQCWTRSIAACSRPWPITPSNSDSMIRASRPAAIRRKSPWKPRKQNPEHGRRPSAAVISRSISNRFSTADLIPIKAGAKRQFPTL